MSHWIVAILGWIRHSEIRKPQSARSAMHLTYFCLLPDFKTAAQSTLGYLASLTTRVSPSRCLGFIQRWPKIRENASHVADLHYHTNPTVYHMSPLCSLLRGDVLQS